MLVKKFSGSLRGKFGGREKKKSTLYQKVSIMNVRNLGELIYGDFPNPFRGLYPSSRGGTGVAGQKQAIK